MSYGFVEVRRRAIGGSSFLASLLRLPGIQILVRRIRIMVNVGFSDAPLVRSFLPDATRSVRTTRSLCSVRTMEVAGSYYQNDGYYLNGCLR